IVVKFRHTGDHPCSGGEGESPPGQPYGLAAELRGLESLALGDGAPVPREFANPTDDTFMVEDAVEAIGFGTFQWKLSILTGLAWMADAMEMMILSILGPQLHCEWKLPGLQVALLTSAVFIGMMISSSLWGNISDKYGRKTGLKLSVLWTMFYGVMSAFAPVYGWMLVLRALVGFGIGGAPQSVTLYAEFLPMRSRATCILLIEIFWALGTVFEVLLAILVMPTLGWRWLLALSTVPLLIFACLCFWLPESARYDVLTGNQEMALATLKRIAAENGVPMPLGKLVAARQESRGKFQDLFSPRFRCTTVLLWFIWFSNAFSYYGLVLLTPELFQESVSLSQDRRAEPRCSLECKALNSDDYKDLLWTTLSEFPGLLVTLWAIDRLGRRKTMALCFFIYSLCLIPLYACVGSPRSVGTQPEVALSTLLHVMMESSVHLTLFHPPPSLQVMMESSVHLTLSVYCCCCLLAAVASCALPIETTGRGLQESSQREWGQEMMGQPQSPAGVPRSSSGSQN
uniref:SV2 related protein n=1 Tax=Gadus morhua TaxID=8049 RepID=A0A8C5BVJ0_GADMO